MPPPPSRLPAPAPRERVQASPRPFASLSRNHSGPAVQHGNDTETVVSRVLTQKTLFVPSQAVSQVSFPVRSWKRVRKN
eukprot:4267967-Prymnesium_polylepis.1